MLWVKPSLVDRSSKPWTEGASEREGRKVFVLFSLPVPCWAKMKPWGNAGSLCGLPRLPLVLDLNSSGLWGLRPSLHRACGSCTLGIHRHVYKFLGDPNYLSSGQTSWRWSNPPPAHPWSVQASGSQIWILGRNLFPDVPLEFAEFNRLWANKYFERPWNTQHPPTLLQAKCNAPSISSSAFPQPFSAWAEKNTSSTGQSVMFIELTVCDAGVWELQKKTGEQGKTNPVKC